jgi:TolA-binding protein
LNGSPSTGHHAHVTATALTLPIMVALPEEDLVARLRPAVQGVAGVSPLYRKAHELYFHDADYDKALVAWDDYLAKEPNGQFAIEARYNRALCLIHLSRFRDAHDALLPFANGEVAPAGYRQDEAKRLEAKLQIRLNGTP